MRPHDANSRSSSNERTLRARSTETGARRHPSSVDLAEFLLGQCSPGTALLVSHHGAHCPSCWSRLLDMGGLDVRPTEPVHGPWSPLTPGLEVAPLQGVSGIGEAVYALRVQGGAQLASDNPLTICELLIWDGALLCDDVAYGIGDFLLFEAGLPATICAHPETGFSALLTTFDAEPPAGEA